MGLVSPEPIKTRQCGTAAYWWRPSDFASFRKHFAASLRVQRVLQSGTLAAVDNALPLALVGLVLVAAYAIGSGFWVETGSPWYRSLKRPPWQPPDFVFGLIWPYNFAVLAVAAWQVPHNLATGQAAIWLAAFGISVAAALLWSWQFYRRRQLRVAAFWLALAALSTLPVVAVPWQVSGLLGALLVPYQLWMTVAASLSIGYARFN